jgi:DHA2 family multidrug resistance protein-like MFS transporter
MFASPHGKWLALAALALAGTVVGLDMTVLNLALPTLATDLHASAGQLQWIVDAYSLVLAAILLPAGLLGDRFGRKKLLMAALVVFGAASVACAYAPSATVLIAARTALGLGAAFIIPLSFSVLPVLFTERERARALTVLIGMVMLAFPIGPIVGGWLLTHFWWGSVFLINVPAVLLALIAVAVFMPESRASRAPRLDPAGVIISSLGLAAVTFGAIEAGQKGWGGVAAVSPLLAGLLALVAFVLWERRAIRRHGQALLDLSLFRSPSFTWGTILVTTVTFSMFGLIFSMPQYFQGVMGMDALGSGLRLLPMIGGLIAGGAAADQLARVAGAKLTVALGFLFVAAGLVAGATTGMSTGYGFAVVWISTLGVGLGFSMPASMDAALGQLTSDRSGVGSAVIQAARQVGGTIGVAILGSLMFSAYRSHLDLGGLPAAAAAGVRKGLFGGVAVAHQLGSAQLYDSVRGAFVHGMDIMLLVCAGLAVAGMALALVFLPNRSRSLETRETARVESPYGPIANK